MKGSPGWNVTAFGQNGVGLGVGWGGWKMHVCVYAGGVMVNNMINTHFISELYRNLFLFSFSSGHAQLIAETRLWWKINKHHSSLHFRVLCWSLPQRTLQICLHHHHHQQHRHCRLSLVYIGKVIRSCYRYPHMLGARFVFVCELYISICGRIFCLHLFRISSSNSMRWCVFP